MKLIPTRAIAAAAGIAIVIASILYATVVSSQPSFVRIYEIDQSGLGQEIGIVNLKDTEYGLLLSPRIFGLSPGLHGFHVHQNPSCQAAPQEGKLVPGLTAGGHYDPEGTGVHLGPYANGHLGDLPALYASESGESVLPILAPRLKVSDLRGRSLIVHAGGDNYSDFPKPLGGGGARVACGLV